MENWTAFYNLPRKKKKQFYTREHISDTWKLDTFEYALTQIKTTIARERGAEYPLHKLYLQVVMTSYGPNREL